jgi:hypothetical protein
MEANADRKEKMLKMSRGQQDGTMKTALKAASKISLQVGRQAGGALAKGIQVTRSAGGGGASSAGQRANVAGSPWLVGGGFTKWKRAASRGSPGGRRLKIFPTGLSKAFSDRGGNGSGVRGGGGGGSSSSRSSSSSSSSRHQSRSRQLNKHPLDVEAD